MRWSALIQPLRHHGHPAPTAGVPRAQADEQTEPRAAAPAAGERLNLLLSYACWRDESWADQLPRLLEPMGVKAHRVTSGTEAASVLHDTPVHIAMVDLSLPLNAAPCSIKTSPRPAPSLDDSLDQEGGERLLQLLARLSAPPPTVVVHRRKSHRETTRQVASALRAGAFAAIERPVHMETVLEVMRRILRRYYANRWPES